MNSIGFIGQTTETVGQHIGNGVTRSVQVPIDTITGIVDRTKPVAPSSKFDGSVYGCAVVQAGREFVPCIGYDEFAPIMANMQPGGLVTFDGKLKTELEAGTGRQKKFFYVRRVHGVEVNPALKQAKRPTGTGRKAR